MYGYYGLLLFGLLTISFPQIVEDLFQCLADNMWKIPQQLELQKAQEKKCSLQWKLSAGSDFNLDKEMDSEETKIMMQNATFDTDKCLNCTIESPQVLVHSTSGKGYGLGSTAMVSGCYKWKVWKPSCKVSTGIFFIYIIIFWLI